MLQHFFLTTVNMSIAATLCGVVVVGLRFLLKNHLPRWVFGLLWFVVLLRLLLPSVPTAPVSAFSALAVPEAVTEGGYASRLAFVEASGVTVEYPSLSPKDSTPTVAPTAPEFILANIWVWGAGLLTLYSLGNYAYLMGKVKKASPLSEEELPPPLKAGRARLFLLEGIRGPVLCGVIAPKILLPPGFGGLPQDFRRMMLAHELAHLKRRDNLVKLVWTLALYLHWFNPFIWFFYSRYVTDMEAACDESALAGAAPPQRAAYASLLLSMTAISRSVFSGGFLAFGESALSQRIMSIVQNRKATTRIVILSLAVVCGLTAAFLTNPGVTPPVPPPGSWSSTLPSSESDTPTEPREEPAASAPSSPGQETSAPPIPILPGNPPALALNWDQVDTVHIFSGSNTFSALPEGAAREIVAALNGVDGGTAAGEQSLPDSYLRIQVRLLTGEKYDYYCGRQLLLLEGGTAYPLADDSLYKGVDALLAAHPRQGAGWLGHMNPYRIVKALAERGDGSREFLTNSPKNRTLLLSLAADLQGVAVTPASYRTFPAGGLLDAVPEPLGTVTLHFDSGVVYTVTFGAAKMAVESSDMDFGTLYDMADPAESLGVLENWVD